MCEKYSLVSTKLFNSEFIYYICFYIFLYVVICIYIRKASEC